ncbi:MAG: GTP-binding protein [Micropruina sp.]|uniref:CobW family GTP-binding protein n=1 Tax=Micropruina sp. TaxID=2737536 RepID=UPI0039E54E00
MSVHAGKLPVIALTGHLGAGKTTLLNHLLHTPGARIGVVVNDFGTINVDAALVSGQIDEPASIAGGCLCCLPDAGGLDEALEKLARPSRRLDAIVIEASGIAEPAALARQIRFSGVDRVRPGGVVDVINAADHFRTVDTEPLPPARYAAASLVVVNKLDRVPPAERAERLNRIAARVRERNPRAHLVAASNGRIDPVLVFDPAGRPEVSDELPLVPEELPLAADDHHHHHQHADAVTVLASGPVDPGRLLDLLEQPPPGAYRIKGCVTVPTARAPRRQLVNLVGTQLHIADDAASPVPDALVAIGMRLDRAAVRARLQHALAPADARPTAASLRRLLRYRRLSA